MRKVFTDNLPKHFSGKNKGQIDWTNSVGLSIFFVYDDFSGNLKILDYNQPQRLVTIRYNDDVANIKTVALVSKAQIGSLIGACNHHSKKHRVAVGTILRDDRRNIEITGHFFLRYENNKYNRKVYSFMCHNCGWKDGTIVESDLLRGGGCACCCGATVVEGINDIPTKAPWMIEYFQGGYDEAKQYTVQSGKKIIFVCSECGRIKGKPQHISTLYRTHSIGCPCGDGKSFPEKFMANVLSQLEIDYICQYYPSWGDGRYFDFYIPNYNLIIETDGGIGHGNIQKGFGSISPEESLRIDKWKDEQAFKHHIQVVRIDAYYSVMRFLKNSIEDKLSSIFDLSNVDWNAASEYATANLVKQVCEFYEFHTTIISEIALEFKLSKDTVTNYLKRGSELSWCSYTVQKSKQDNFRRAASRNIEKFSKKVNVYSDSFIMFSYPSVADCIRSGEKDLGIKISKGGIYRALKHEVLYKGFRFKYVS